MVWLGRQLGSATQPRPLVALATPLAIATAVALVTPAQYGHSDFGPPVFSDDGGAPPPLAPAEIPDCGTLVSTSSTGFVIEAGSGGYYLFSSDCGDPNATSDTCEPTLVGGVPAGSAVVSSNNYSTVFEDSSGGLWNLDNQTGAVTELGAASPPVPDGATLVSTNYGCYIFESGGDYFNVNGSSGAVTELAGIGAGASAVNANGASTILEDLSGAFYNVDCASGSVVNLSSPPEAGATALPATAQAMGPNYSLADPSSTSPTDGVVFYDPASGDYFYVSGSTGQVTNLTTSSGVPADATVVTQPACSASTNSAGAVLFSTSDGYFNVNTNDGTVSQLTALPSNATEVGTNGSGSIFLADGQVYIYNVSSSDTGSPLSVYTFSEPECAALCNTGEDVCKACTPAGLTEVYANQYSTIFEDTSGNYYYFDVDSEWPGLQNNTLTPIGFPSTCTDSGGDSVPANPVVVGNNPSGTIFEDACGNYYGVGWAAPITGLPAMSQPGCAQVGTTFDGSIFDCAGNLWYAYSNTTDTVAAAQLTTACAAASPPPAPQSGQITSGTDASGATPKADPTLGGACSTPPPPPNLQVSKTASATAAAAGAGINWNVTVSNTGDGVGVASLLNMVDTLADPAQATLTGVTVLSSQGVSSDLACSLISGGQAACSANLMAAGGTFTIQVAGTLAAGLAPGTQVVARAHVSHTSPSSPRRYGQYQYLWLQCHLGQAR